MAIGSETTLSPRKIEEEYEIPPKALRAALRRDELTGFKKGRLVFIERVELERWIKTTIVQPVLDRGRKVARG